MDASEYPYATNELVDAGWLVKFWKAKKQSLSEKYHEGMVITFCPNCRGGM
jgi:hypothetical protein